jgi:polysaccharide deacetylase 2 family uncharacterized protein YibQ
MILPRRHVVAGALAATALIRATPSHAQSMLVELDPSQAAVAPAPVTGDGLPPTGALAASAPADTLPPWRRNAVVAPALDGRPAITLVIDDMGVMHRYTDLAVALPGPLTLAWFPFAQKLPEQVAAATARGHEAMLHMPMQAYSDSIRQTGPDPLRIDLPPAVNQGLLRTAIAAVPHIVGVNNHMGSVATRDPLLMELVAREVQAHGMLFLDSVVVSHSVALCCAELAGVPAAARDVFIDNVAAPSVIWGQLSATEAFARRHGHAIAIAHPRLRTLAALEVWLPTLAARGFVLWPLSATVAWRNNLDPTHIPT